MAHAAHGRLFGYGVWRAPVLVEGLPAIWAVDSFGDVKKVRKLRPGDDEEALGDRLWEWLLTHHPERPRAPRKLELLREPTRHPTHHPKHHPTAELVRDSATRRMIDARMLTDPRSPLAKRRYLTALAGNASRHIRRFDRDI